MPSHTPYIDIHAHPTKSFYDDVADVLRRARALGVHVITIGTSVDDSEEGVALAEEHEHVFAIIGQHPTTVEPYANERFEHLAHHSKVLGFGETGFDFFRGGESDRVRQQQVFEAHIRLAIEHAKPLMLHIRPSKDMYDAYEATYDVLAAYAGEYRGQHFANVHFFAGTIDIARKFLDLGCTISFTGVITFAPAYQDLVQYVPMDRVLSETDSPFVAPVPHRGKTNEPAYVIEVVRHLAKLHGVSEEHMVEQIWGNAQRLFGPTLT